MINISIIMFQNVWIFSTGSSGCCKGDTSHRKHDNFFAAYFALQQQTVCGPTNMLLTKGGQLDSNRKQLNFWLVVYLTLWKILVNWKDYPIYYGNNNACSKPPTSKDLNNDTNMTGPRDSNPTLKIWPRLWFGRFERLKPGPPKQISLELGISTGSECVRNQHISTSIYLVSMVNCLKSTKYCHQTWLGNPRTGNRTNTLQKLTNHQLGITFRHIWIIWN